MEGSTTHYLLFLQKEYSQYCVPLPPVIELLTANADPRMAEGRWEVGCRCLCSPSPRPADGLELSRGRCGDEETWLRHLEKLRLMLADSAGGLCGVRWCSSEGVVNTEQIFHGG